MILCAGMKTVGRGQFITQGYGKKGEKDGKGDEKEKLAQNQSKSDFCPPYIDPVAGEMTSEMKNVCKKFEDQTGFRVAVQTRAGRANEKQQSLNH